jgi:hypothetical protein
MVAIEPIALEPVDALTITTLVGNLTDILLVDEGPAVRAKLGSGPRVPAPALAGGEAFDALRAEHGFAALVTFSRGGREHRVCSIPGSRRTAWSRTCDGWSSRREMSRRSSSVTATSTTSVGWTG